MEVCFEIINRSNDCLRGILHKGNPENYKKIVLICLNTGLNDMVGWHRIQVKTARYLSAQGYNIIRYDDTGIGDSDGIIKEESIVEIFTQIETGLFVENANAVAEFVSNKFINHKIIFLGFCGGGLTGIYSATSNKIIDGVITIGAPVTLSSKEYYNKQDPWAVGKNIEKYRSKLFNLKAWFRFFTFRGEYRTVFNSIYFFVKHKMHGAYDNSTSGSEEKSVNLNLKFIAVFTKYLKRKIPTLFFYAENDSATWEFKKYFLNKFKAEHFGKNKNNTFVEAPKANHILSSRDSQGLLNKEIHCWIEKYF